MGHFPYQLELPEASDTPLGDLLLSLTCQSPSPDESTIVCQMEFELKQRRNNAILIDSNGVDTRLLIKHGSECLLVDGLTCTHYVCIHR